MGSQYNQPKDTVVTRIIMIPIDIASSVIDDEIRYREYLLAIPGIVGLHIDATGELEISYDVNVIEYDEILVHLEKIGLPISYSLWEHVKSAWFQYVDAATRTKPTHNAGYGRHSHNQTKHKH